MGLNHGPPKTHQKLWILIMGTMVLNSIHTAKNLFHMLNEKHASKFLIFGWNMLDKCVKS